MGELGNYRKEITTKTGKKVLVRTPGKGDVEELMKFINTLVEEDTFISNTKKVTRKEEDKYVEGLLEKMNEKNGFYILAEFEGKIIANSGIERGDKSKRQDHLAELSISVAKGFRNEGLGKILIGELLKAVKDELGLKLVYLTVFGINERAIYVYRKLGFRECGRIPDGILYKGKYVDQVYMCKKL